MEAFTHVSKQLPLLHLSIQAIQRRMWVNCHILTCIALWNTTIPLFSQILSCLLEKKTQKWAGYLQFSHLPLTFIHTAVGEKCYLWDCHRYQLKRLWSAFPLLFFNKLFMEWNQILLPLKSMGRIWIGCSPGSYSYMLWTCHVIPISLSTCHFTCLAVSWYELNLLLLFLFSLFYFH